MAPNWAEREAVCAQCPFKIKKKCTKCGCFTALKCKIKNSNCPEGLWGTKSDIK